MSEQLAKLARPFPKSYIAERPQGGRTVHYVEHAQVTAKILATCGPFNQHVEHVTGDTWKVSLGVMIDDRLTLVEEVSTDPEPETAVSRALCRAAMRLGLGLHLWTNKTPYKLAEALAKDDPADNVIDENVVEAVEGARQAIAIDHLKDMAEPETVTDRIDAMREKLHPDPEPGASVEDVRTIMRGLLDTHGNAEMIRWAQSQGVDISLDPAPTPKMVFDATIAHLFPEYDLEEAK